MKKSFFAKKKIILVFRLFQKIPKHVEGREEMAVVDAQQLVQEWNSQKHFYEILMIIL
jgi:hypothetical protein